MTEDKRQHQRIIKHLTLKYCLADVSYKAWDMSVVDNISMGGLKFAASTEVDLNDKVLQLQIKIPGVERYLDLKAQVVATVSHPDGKIIDVRAKFISLSAADAELLSALEKMQN